MSGFFVSYMEVSFPCSKETFGNIEARYRADQEEGFLTDLVLDYSELDQAGILSFRDSEVFRDFDGQIIDFNSICMDYGTSVKGHYICDTDDNDSVRVDIDGSKPAEKIFDSYGCSWLLNYTVEQIKAIQEKAKEMFPKQPVDRSDSSED